MSSGNLLSGHVRAAIAMIPYTHYVRFVQWGFSIQYIRDANMYVWHTIPLNRTRDHLRKMGIWGEGETNKLDGLYLDEISINKLPVPVAQRPVAC
jgi:hypothetical protein